jgi:hypothetical protein
MARMDSIGHRVTEVSERHHTGSRPTRNRGPRHSTGVPVLCIYAHDTPLETPTSSSQDDRYEVTWRTPVDGIGDHALGSTSANARGHEGALHKEHASRHAADSDHDAGHARR